MILFLTKVLILSLSGVLAPGPVMTSAIAMGSKSRHAGLVIALGHCTLELPLLIIIALGAGFIFEYQAAKTAIGLIGGAYLLWMGWGMFKEFINYHEAKININARGPFITGFMLSATNPYFLLWWATVGLNLAKDAVSIGYLAVVLFAIVHFLCDTIWLEIISFASFKGTKLLSEKNQRNVLAFCAAAIIFFGFYFIAKSILLR